MCLTIVVSAVHGRRYAREGGAESSVVRMARHAVVVKGDDLLLSVGQRRREDIRDRYSTAARRLARSPRSLLLPTTLLGRPETLCSSSAIAQSRRETYGTSSAKQRSWSMPRLAQLVVISAFRTAPIPSLSPSRATRQIELQCVSREED